MRKHCGPIPKLLRKSALRPSVVVVATSSRAWPDFYRAVSQKARRGFPRLCFSTTKFQIAEAGATYGDERFLPRNHVASASFSAVVECPIAFEAIEKDPIQVQGHG